MPSPRLVKSSPHFVPRRAELYQEAEQLRLQAQELLDQAFLSKQFKKYRDSSLPDSELPKPLIIKSFTTQEREANDQIDVEKYEDLRNALYHEVTSSPAWLPIYEKIKQIRRELRITFYLEFTVTTETRQLWLITQSSPLVSPRIRDFVSDEQFLKDLGIASDKFVDL